VGARLPRKRHLRNSGAVDYQSLDQFNVLGRIDTVMATGENGDRAGLQAGAVCCRIDAARETGDDGDSRSTEITRHSVGEFHASGRSVAGSDDRDLRPPREGAKRMLATRERATRRKTTRSVCLIEAREQNGHGGGSGSKPPINSSLWLVAGKPSGVFVVAPVVFLFGSAK